MEDTMQQTLIETVAEVFETMFFTFLEPIADSSSDEELPGQGNFIESVISYEGDFSGEFVFYFPRELAESITVNFLGIDDDELEDSQVIDTASETVNMVVGSFLGKMDPHGNCALGIPDSTEVADFSPAALQDDPSLCVFNTEFGMMLVIHEGS